MVTDYYLIDDISIYPLPEIKVISGKTICEGDTIHLKASVFDTYNGVGYKWYGKQDALIAKDSLAIVSPKKQLPIILF